jgi:hypothetical protein
MALVGGGGAPNVAGSNPAGVGKGLSYMGGGVHAGWSGTIQIGSSAAAAVQFEFGSGSQHLIAEYIFGIEGENIDTNSYYGFQISIDDQLVYEQTSRATTTTPSSVIGQPFNFVIPAFSKVKIEGRTTDTGGDTPCYGMLTCKEIGYDA